MENGREREKETSKKRRRGWKGKWPGHMADLREGVKSHVEDRKRKKGIWLGGRLQNGKEIHHYNAC